MKPLKFAPPLPEKVLSGEKTITWRINDEKNLSCGDELSLLRSTNTSEFARAVIIWVKETTFGALTEEDCEGHESFASEEEKYKTYSRYYNTEITPASVLKVIKFKLL